MADIGLPAAAAMARVLVPSKPCRPNRSSAHRSKISGESVSLAMYVTCSFDVNARWRDGSRARLSQLSRPAVRRVDCRSEEHTSELQSIMRISYAVFCLKKKKQT